MAGLRVLVVGASIAGPATAYWLAKAGAKVTVIERFAQLRTAGQAVDLRTAGVSVMRKIPGMEAQVRARSTQEEGVAFVREDGRPYGTIRATGNPDQQSIISEYEIFRGDLSRVLYNLTKDNENVNYVFGEQIAATHQSEKGEGKVKVEFSNGLPSNEYDLVIACDGAFSRTRAMGLECGVGDHVHPTNWWTAYFSIDKDLLKGSRISHGVSAIGGRSITIGTDPKGFSRVMLMSVGSRSDHERALPFRQALSAGEEAVKRYLATAYADVGWKTRECMEGMMTSKDFYASEIVQVKVPTLHRGRFVLVGDAGYAAGPTGGGTSLALAGAYMLAGELGKHPGDIEAGLRGYGKQMEPLITELQKIPPFVSTILAPQTAWGIWIRNQIFALVAWSGLVEVVQKYLGTAFADTKAFPLPEYEWAY
jgi:2-polyprenyl-6-methoxyphenol hydroxylase-like FAD-dependent oxidoreductase